MSLAASRPQYGDPVGTIDKASGRVVLTEAWEKFIDELVRSAAMTIAENVVLQKSAAQVATANGASMAGLGNYRAAEFQLDVTAAAAVAGDTLDAFVQTLIDGVNWIDVAHFTQVLGNGGPQRFVAKVVADQGEAMFAPGTVLAAGSIRNILGNKYRARWAIAGGSAAFTFSVSANFLP